MASEMIERVGLALQAAWGNFGDPNTLPPIDFYEKELSHLARAAIEAMREPTSEMRDAGAGVIAGTPKPIDVYYDDAEDVWKVMLTAALEPRP